MTDKLRLIFTVPQIAQHLGKSVQEVEWALEDLALQPSVAGNALLFEKDDVERIRVELNGKPCCEANPTRSDGQTLRASVLNPA